MLNKFKKLDTNININYLWHVLCFYEVRIQ
jgi:hypothetical protein